MNAMMMNPYFMLDIHNQRVQALAGSGRSRGRTFGHSRSRRVGVAGPVAGQILPFPAQSSVAGDIEHASARVA